MVEHLNAVAVTSSFILAIYNTVSIISARKPLIYFFTHVLIFLLIGIFCIFNKKINLIKIGLYLMGLVMLFNSDNANFTGIIYICFAVYLNKNLTINLWAFAIAMAIIFLKGAAFNFFISETIHLLMGCVVTALIFFIITRRDKLSIKITRDVEDLEIIDMLASGLNPKQIGGELNITDNAVNKRIQKTREAYGCASVPQLICELAKSGKIGKDIHKGGI